MTAEKQSALQTIEEKRDLITGIADKIWEFAELSLQEFKSAAAYCEALEKEGFEVERGTCNIETAFAASYGHGRPYIGILAEYDALSGLSQEAGLIERKAIQEGGNGHGCGHNLLGAGAFAAALGVKAYLEKNKMEGTVILYGCPGEEGGAAKAFMARDNMWRALDAAFCWHPEDVNEVKTGTNNSTIQVMYTFHGRSAHAAGDPENGRSALDAVELMNTGVQYLREHMKSECRVHYAITDAGGISPNVVQDHATVLYMVRAGKVRNCVELQKRVDKIAEGAALMTETTFERTFIDGTADLVPNFALEKVLYDNFAQVELPTYTEEELAFAGKVHATCPVNTAPGFAPTLDEEIRSYSEEKSQHGTIPINNYLMPLYHSTAFCAGSTDVGDVSWQTPTAQVHCAGFVSGAPGHSWQNVSCGGSSIGHKALLLAGKVLALSAIDLYEKPELLKEARAEFEKRTESGYVCPIEEGAKPITI